MGGRDTFGRLFHADPLEADVSRNGAIRDAQPSRILERTARTISLYCRFRPLRPKHDPRAARA